MVEKLPYVLAFFLFSLGRCIQGINLGILFPWALHLRLEITSVRYRYIVSIYISIMLIGTAFSGYLIRIIGSSIEVYVYTALALFLSIFGMFSVFLCNFPSRILNRFLNRFLRESSKQKRAKKSENAAGGPTVDMQQDSSSSVESLFVELLQALENVQLGNDSLVFAERLVNSYVRDSTLISSSGRCAYFSSSCRVFSRWLFNIVSIGVGSSFRRFFDRFSLSST